MKVISLLVVKVLAVIVANLAFFWAIIEFILYLVKDKVFNWWSVWTFCISVAVALVVVAYGGIYAIKNRNKALNSLKKMREDKPKSRFQQKLDKAMEQANTKA
jgi:high-affinity Fe2+/Pb2+ permease